MNEVTLYWLPNCSTCKKAKVFLEINGVIITKFHDLKASPPSRQEVEKLAELVGGVERLFSRRAIKYRELGLAQRKLSNDEMLDLMSSEYTFIKRPVLVINDKAKAGFSEKDYHEILAK